jgi:hypothetical protein
MYLKLDPSIRNWVLFPITVITVSVNLLMKYLHILFNLNQGKGDSSSGSKRGTNDFDIKAEIARRDSDFKLK